MAKSKHRSTVNIPLARRYSLAKVKAGVDLASEDAVNQVVAILSLPPERTGIKHAKLPNRSSKPGESPAPQTGGLRQGVAKTPSKLKGKTVYSQVASRSKHAAKLELGTENFPARPYLRRLLTEEPRRKRLLAVFAIGARRV